MASRFVWYVDPAGADTNSGSSSGATPRVNGTQATWSAGGTVVTVEASDLSGVTANVDTINLSGAENTNTRKIYHIVAVDDGANTVTVAETLTNASTGNCAWAIGGALATVQKAFDNLNAISGTLYDHLYIKGGTDYAPGGASTPAFSLALAGGRDVLTFVEGYTTTPGDGGFAVLSGAGNTTTSLVVMADTSTHEIVRNIKFIQARSNGSSYHHSSGVATTVEHCWGTDTQNGCRTHFRMSAIGAKLVGCRGDYASGSAGVGNGFETGEMCFYLGCIGHDNTGDGFNHGQVRSTNLAFCIGDTNGRFGHFAGGSGTNYAQSCSINNCTFYGNGSDGLELSDSTSNYGNLVANCIFDTNTGYGINRIGVASGFPLTYEAYNNFNGNTVAPRNNVSDVTANDVTPTDFIGACLTDPANQDFTVNTNARGKGFPGAFPV